jgi:opacity protein-like surface antigen
MKRAIFTAVFALACLASSNAQLLRLGVKAGPNFSNFSGGADDISYSGRTSFHAGAVAEIGILPIFSIQPELLYTSQGADVDGVGDFNLDYVAVPVLVKIYLIKDKFSIEAGPQFSFLIDEAEEALENEKFELAAAGGVGINITKNFFAQARYTYGLTEVSKDAGVKNSVLQLSLGYMFF